MPPITLLFMFLFRFRLCISWETERWTATLDLNYDTSSERHSIRLEYILLYIRLPRLRVCLCAKFDQFLPVRSHFDTKRPVNFFHIATFPSPTFGPLFAFHCPLFSTKNNNLECREPRCFGDYPS